MTWAAAIGAAATGLSGAVKAVGALQQGEAESQAASYNAQVQRQNAQIEQQNANWAGQAGEVQAAAQEQKTRSQVGAIKAAEAANNLDVNSGSAVDVRSSAAQLGELSALNIRSNAAKQAYGYETQSWNAQAQANLDQADAAYARQAGEIGAAGDLLGGIGGGWTSYLTTKGLPGSTGS
jgi:hypothetical protein